jgi:hypothetical protein
MLQQTQAPHLAVPLEGATSPNHASAKPVAVGPLPLVLGITGHRDLRDEDLPALEERVEGIIAHFRERNPHTPLVLLSPLADGADRLAARVALRCGVRLIVPLPLGREEYARDFETGASHVEFEALLQRADDSFELPLIAGNTATNTHEQNGHRAEQYAFVGAYIVRHCQVLIALWNGTAGPDGGTGDIVQFQRHGIPARFRAALAEADGGAHSFLDPGETGAVFHIVTPRRSHPGLQGEPLSLHTYFPGDEEPPAGTAGTHHPGGHASSDNHSAHGASGTATFRRICDNIEAFNRNALFIDKHQALAKAQRQNADYLLPDAEAATLPPGLRVLRERFAVADTLALHFQRLTLVTLRRLCVLVFAAVLSFEITAKLFPHDGWSALIFPALLGLTYFLWYGTVRREKWQDRYQDYRALAEGMRVEFFWRLAGLRASVADHYLRKQRGEMDWIRIAIRNMAAEAGDRTAMEGDSRGFGLVMEHWVQNQARWFARAAHRDHHELERYEGWIKGLMIASPIVATLTALAMILPTPAAHWMHEQEKAHKLLIILVFVLAGVAGVLHTYIDKRALSQHAKQYERMANLFALAEKRVQECLRGESPLEARQIVLELGKESLAENGDWVLTHRERPVDVPHAG